MGILDTNDKVWEASRAGESVATLAAIIRSTIHLVVIGRHNVVVQEEESGTGVSNAVNAGRCKATISNCITGTGELPEAIGGVDRRVGDVTSIFAAVDDAKGITSWLAFLQIGSKHILSKDTFIDGSVEEGGLLCRSDCGERSINACLDLNVNTHRC